MLHRSAGATKGTRKSPVLEERDSQVQAENYVVRIYRRGEPDRQSVVGVVEAVSSGWQKPFQSLEELADILARPRHRSQRSAERRQTTKSSPVTEEK